MGDISTYLTKVNKFDPKSIDFEQIKKDKSIYNIYNNSIREPFHNFWFLLNNCKFIKLYENDKSMSIKIALNDKNDKHNKTLEYIKDIIKFIHSECLNVFPKITYEVPWKNDDNYPIILTLYCKELLFLDENNEELTIDKLQFNNSVSYTILFEISFFIIKENKIKFYLNQKIIQIEKKLNLRNGIIHIKETSNVRTFNDDISSRTIITDREIPKDKSKDKPSIGLILSTDMILQKRNQLKSISKELKDLKENKEEIKTMGDQFLEQKKLLKSINPSIEIEVEVEEEKPIKKKKSKKSKHKDS